MSQSTDMQLGQLIKETGDFGRFQVVITIIFAVELLALNWSMMTMAYTGAVPDFDCTVMTSSGYVNATVMNVCDVNKTSCDVINFDASMRTAVSEASSMPSPFNKNIWELVCDKKWISQTMTTIQMSGLLIGGLFFGHVSDYFGRKPTFFFSLVMLGTCNLVSIFSTSWEMFAAMRFLIGMGCTCFMASNIGFEFIRNKWRIYLYLIPSWAFWAGVMAVFCWRIHDWRYIHVVITVVAFGSLPLWFIIPESFRWQMAKGKIEDAEKTIQFLAKFNGRSVPDLSRLKDIMKAEKDLTSHRQTGRVYTVIDLFRTSRVRKTTIIFSLVWLFSSYSYYGIAFGVQELSGNYYLNMFLLSVVDIPGNILLVILNTCGGRRWTCVGFYTLGGAVALTFGVLKYLGIEIPGMFLLALAAKLSVSAAWEINTTWSAESFPTVVRNIGGGFISSISRLGSMVAPQIITLSKDIPGLLYTVSGIVCIISAGMCIFLEETKNRDLPDTIYTEKTIIEEPPLNNVHVEQVKQPTVDTIGVNGHSPNEKELLEKLHNDIGLESKMEQLENRDMRYYHEY